MFLSRWGLRLNVRADANYPSIVPMMANGGYQFRVSEPSLFLQQLVGGLSAFSADAVNQNIRMFLVERLTQNFSKAYFTDVYGKLDVVSTQAKVSVADAFSQRGLELLDLKIEGVDSTPDGLAQINRVLGLQGPSRDAVLTDRQLDIMKTFAENPQGGGTMGGQMISLLPAGPMAATMQASMTPSAAPPRVVLACPNCGTHNATDSGFCSKCGHALGAGRAASPPVEGAVTSSPGGAFNACPYCGKELNLPKTPRFCPFCKEPFS
jgi:membrane protease subunit (stomatin/prohibitin family)